MAVSYIHIYPWNCSIINGYEFCILAERKLLKMSLSGLISSVGVITSPGKLIIASPTVSRVLCVSDFCGCILATNIT